MKVSLFVSALVIALCTSGAHAALITFNLSGTFSNGAVLGGSITIDNAAGTVTAYNATVGPPDTGSFTVGAGASVITTYYNITIDTPTSSGGFPGLVLALPVTTLVGYSGGSICSVAAPCSSVASALFETNTMPAFQLSNGSAAPAPPAPPAISAIPVLSLWALGALAALLAASGALLHRRAKTF
jgi:hypothetical protein